MKVLILVVIITLIDSAVYSQDDTLRWRPDYKLQWSDFKGEIDETSPFDAWTWTGLQYNYKYTYTGSLYNVTFNIYSTFNKNKSWSKGSNHSKALLEHEQLHFDIVQYIARQFKKEVESYTYSSDIKNEISEIYKRHIENLKNTQLKYDEETDHYKRRKKQKEWETCIHQELQD